MRNRIWCLVVSSGAAVLLLACDQRPAPDRLTELAASHLPTIEGEIVLPGLSSQVEVLRDPWGVPHIFADNLDDLFFAQGFVQAQDRLWQMDMYRRAGQGRLAEILGPDYVRHDQVARLMGYRGPWTDEEFGSYHPDGRQILEAFARGVNAYIESAADRLPVEYTLTGITPLPWTPQASLLRMQTAMPIGNGRSELRLAQQVAELGTEEANRRARPNPYRELSVPNGIDLSLIGEEVAEGLAGFQGGGPRPELLEPALWENISFTRNLGVRETSPGSNNWVAGPRLNASGQVILANDPHRGVANPSLRYVVHLDAPGWTAIGSTEPVLPGVAIGHNGRVAWGLTIVGTDQSDVYVEEVNPENPREVKWNGNWEPVEVVTDTIMVKGGDQVVVELEYTRHGPIFHRDESNNLAYALRSTMHEPGSTGYLASLRLNVVNNCTEFLGEMKYWKAPTENMICGDIDGNIAWQAAAASPKREGWHGRLPVPGTGAYEWDGFRSDLPEEFNPERGWIGTANHNIHPPGYDPPLFFKSATTFPRFDRLQAVLSGRTGFTLQDHIDLQQDAYSAAANADLPFFRGWTSEDPVIERARADLAAWDAVYQRDSRAAAIYSAVRREIPDAARANEGSEEARHSLLEGAIQQGLDNLLSELGEDLEEWRWGMIQRSEFPHRFVSAYDLPSVERSGGAGTMAATGATYRHIVDFSDFDNSVFTNAPGQSGRPGSPFYGNLSEPWGAGEYFPMLFTKEAVEARAEYRLMLVPAR